MEEEGEKSMINELDIDALDTKGGYILAPPTAKLLLEKKSLSGQE